MMFEDMPDEWKEWIDLTPMERLLANVFETATIRGRGGGRAGMKV